jgi:hypothetical protein
MIEKMAPYNAGLIKRIKLSGLKVETKKLLGNDGGTTGYMTLRADEKTWELLAKKKIYAFTMAWRDTNAISETDPVDEKGNAIWRAKRRKPKSPEPNKFLKFVRTQIKLDDDIWMRVTAEKYFKDKHMLKLFLTGKQDATIALLVKPLTEEAEKLAMPFIHRIGLNKYMILVYPYKNWIAGDCMKFRVIARYRKTEDTKGKWYLKTAQPYQKDAPTPTFEGYVSALNAVQEDRWAGSVYDGPPTGRLKIQGERRYSQDFKDANTDFTENMDIFERSHKTAEELAVINKSIQIEKKLDRSLSTDKKKF